MVTIALQFLLLGRIVIKGSNAGCRDLKNLDATTLSQS